VSEWATFTDWLRSSHYRESTVKGTVRQVREAEGYVQSGRTPPDRTLAALRRFMLFAQEHPAQRGTLYKSLSELGVRAVERTPSEKPKQRKHDAVSFSAEEWEKLRARVWESRLPEACVLKCMLSTGLRVGDVLRVERRRLTAGLDSGRLSLERKGGFYIDVPIAGAAEVWEELHGAMVQAGAQTAAALVCPTNPSPEAGDAAYQRIVRGLQRFGREAGITSRVHTHRIRRTVAVRALHQTDNLEAVRQLLAQKSIISTQRYTDELQMDQVAALQRSLGEKGGT
jgi:site-specific recombinase XerC